MPIGKNSRDQGFMTGKDKPFVNYKLKDAIAGETAIDSEGNEYTVISDIQTKTQPNEVKVIIGESGGFHVKVKEV